MTVMQQRTLTTKKTTSNSSARKAAAKRSRGMSRFKSEQPGYLDDKNYAHSLMFGRIMPYKWLTLVLRDVREVFEGLARARAEPTLDGGDYRQSTQGTFGIVVDGAIWRKCIDSIAATSSMPPGAESSP
jgi:hypothetical protein